MIGTTTIILQSTYVMKSFTIKLIVINIQQNIRCMIDKQLKIQVQPVCFFNG